MDNPQRHPIALKPVVLRLDGMDAVPVRHDVEYAATDAGALTFDLYRPPAVSSSPVVVLVTGYPDVGVPRPLGCAFKDMAVTKSLAQLLAVSGLAAVCYTSRQPATDVDLVFEYIVQHAPDLKVAPKFAVWAMSGHVPVALAALMRHGSTIRAAVLSNGFTLDLDGSAVADASHAYRFVNAAAGRSVGDLPRDVPLFLVRSGRDEFAGLNDTLDRFTAGALARNLPITIVNHPMAPHAFELHDDSDVTRQLIRQMIAFVRFWLTRVDS